MPVALGIVLGVLLATVFSVAAFGKLSDRAGTRAAVAGFGVPEALGGAVALALPVAELAVAGLLLLGSTRVAGAAGALGLLALFTAAIVANLLRGRTPECHCFGALHSAPVGWRTAARNAVLAVLAAVLLITAGSAPGPSAVAWIGRLGLAEMLALAAVLGALGLATVGVIGFLSLMRADGRLLVQVELLQRTLSAAGIEVPQEHALAELGRDPGTPAPDFAAETVSGQRVSLEQLLEPGLPLLLTFTSPGCGPCRALLPALARWQREHAGVLSFATITDGEAAASRSETQHHELDTMLVDHELAVYDAYQATGTPSAVLISADGQIASYLAAGPETIEQLLEGALSGEGETQGLPIGSLAPQLDLRGLDDEPVVMADPAGGDTLVLFYRACARGDLAVTRASAVRRAR